ncbi:MAG TPA: phosphatase PAP2 family protein [Pyrinomonadaceae bacterium]|nr:phosphatase PAP2 family protein [Pyrinomonadaceae bacterium]
MSPPPDPPPREAPRPRGGSLLPAVAGSRVGRLVGGGVGYLLTRVLPALGLLLSLGLVAAAAALYLFAELAGEVSEGDTRRFDEWALSFVNGFASPPVTSFMRGVTYLGSNEFLLAAGGCALLAFLLAGWRRAAVALAVTMAGAAVLNSVLKLAFRRERPPPFFDTPPPESYSFPSGHALLCFCFYGVLAAVIAARLRGRRPRAFVWAAAALLVALVGLSRLYLGVHYPSDVAAGYAAAFVWVVAVASADRLMQARAGETAG